MKKLFIIICIALFAGIIIRDLEARGGGGHGGGGRGGRGGGRGGFGRGGHGGRGGRVAHSGRGGHYGGRGYGRGYGYGGYGYGFGAGFLAGALLTPIAWDGGYIGDVYYGPETIVCVDESGNYYPCSVDSNGAYVPLYG